MQKVKIKVYDNDINTEDMKNVLVAYLEVYLMKVTDDIVELANKNSTELNDAILKLYLTSRHLGTEINDKGKTYGYIHALYVAHNYERKGISSFLLDNLSLILNLYHNISDLTMIAVCNRPKDIGTDINHNIHILYNSRSYADDIMRVREMTNIVKEMGFTLCTNSDDRWYFRRYNY